MEIVIHACPERMWYVDGFLVPTLKAQGAGSIEIWNDEAELGCLRSCMECFAARKGDGGAWHIQDDVLISSRFMETARQHDEGLVYGFCNEYFLDDTGQCGRVYMEDAWHSFQCVRIPHAWARECAEWFFSRAWETESPSTELPMMEATNRGDDTFFREFALVRHGTETAVNLRPNIVEHVDLLLGGSVLHPYRDYRATAHWWDEEDLTAQLRADLKAQRLGSWADAH